MVELLGEQNPDIFALLEVEGKTVFNDLVERMPGYQFHITEGRQVQEALVDIKKEFTAAEIGQGASGSKKRVVLSGRRAH